MTTSSDEQFRVWLLEVDQILKSECGLGHEDLPDQCYRNMFEAGDSPQDAATEALGG